MDKMIVDPELFITCRLCLVQKGQYQIVPCVQQQIKFCFDIDVQPFDGLPQLICTECEKILCNFNNIKAKFQDRQLQLKSKIAPGCSDTKNVKTSIIQEEDVVTSTEQTEEKEDDIRSEYFGCVMRKRTISSDEKIEKALESDSCASNHSSKKIKLKKSQKHANKWQADYEKLFACRYCLSCFKDTKSTHKHLKKHEALLKKYKLKNCSVPLHKVDGKANITGLQNALVLNHSKIIQNTKENFNVLFVRKTQSQNVNVENTSSSDSSDGNINVKKKAKRFRLLSQSSNETVVLEGSTKQNVSGTEVTRPKHSVDKAVIEYVDIWDSGESDVEKKISDTATKNNGRSKIISNTVASCLNKYINKNNSSDNCKNNKESLLIHKFLSIGTKIINKKEFSCTGILRFLEYKNLNVSWNPRPNKINQCVRIVTKLKEPVAPDNDIGWKNISTLTKDREIVVHDLLEKIYEYEANFSTHNLSSQKSPCKANLQSDIATLDQVVISVQNQSEKSQLKILLNQNPVANPKQLTKKPHSRPNQSSIQAKVIPRNSARDLDQDMVMPLPIITQSISLARLPEEVAVVESTSALEGGVTRTCDDITSTFQPRIKVKPASQLMAPTASDIISSSSHLNWNTPEPTSYTPVNDAFNDTNKKTESVQNTNKYVIMHTVELPNTKTSSPFLYCKNLFQIHNIVLLDSNDPISTDYMCLIKFKSIFNQDNQQSVTLGLGLFSDSNNFAMKLKDMNKLINITSLLPRWQWEVIQLYRGDEITAKLRDNAMSMGQNMFRRTNYFINVLKCIVFRD